MGTYTEKLCRKYFRPEDHPYVLYEKLIESLLEPGHTLMDAGCGRGAPNLLKFKDKCARLVGVDMVDPLPEAIEAGVEYHKGDLATTGLPDNLADVIISRSVLEHLEDPETVFAEFARILKPGGTFVALTPNIGDYVSIISMMIPNALHPWIVKMTEGRAEEDTFPTFYRANSRRALRRLTKKTGLELEEFRYRGQYPASFMFNPVLFMIATGYEKVISRFECLGFLRGWIMAVMRKPNLTAAPESQKMASRPNGA